MGLKLLSSIYVEQHFMCSNKFYLFIFSSLSKSTEEIYIKYMKKKKPTSIKENIFLFIPIFKYFNFCVMKFLFMASLILGLEVNLEVKLRNNPARDVPHY